MRLIRCVLVQCGALRQDEGNLLGVVLHQVEASVVQLEEIAAQLDEYVLLCSYLVCGVAFVGVRACRCCAVRLRCLPCLQVH